MIEWRTHRQEEIAVRRSGAFSIEPDASTVISRSFHGIDSFFDVVMTRNNIQMLACQQDEDGIASSISSWMIG